MEKEKWVWLTRDGLPRYAVSSFGRVFLQKYFYDVDSKRMVTKGKPEELKRHIEPDGSVIVWLWDENKNRPFQVADLVLEAFCGPKFIDGDKQNCSLHNLGWVNNQRSQNG